jgi:hypothetical protein
MYILTVLGSKIVYSKEKSSLVFLKILTLDLSAFNGICSKLKAIGSLFNEIAPNYLYKADSS